MEEAKVAAVILIVVAIGWAVFPKDNRHIPHNLTAEVENAIQRSEQIGKTKAKITVKNPSADEQATARTIKLSSNAALASLLDEMVLASILIMVRSLSSTLDLLMRLGSNLLLRQQRSYW